jgi:peptidoglycan/xylan/chitin deacetylase (PgdA/CDA1 family)
VSDSALAVTVDVDGEAGLAGGGSLSARSERLYGVRRGLERVVAVLAGHGVHATFYVPGITAERHPDAIRSIVAHGHEVGHHGHTHRSPHGLTADAQRLEIEQGLSALAALGIEAHGYRAPAWELTDVTLELLAQHGFAYDSSLMDDDRPYELGGLLELPVHWTLDDAPYFAADPGNDRLLGVWTRELELAAEEERPITVTLHPEILGRPHRIGLLQRLIEHAAALGVPTLTHAELATRYRRRGPRPAGEARAPGAPSSAAADRASPARGARSRPYRSSWPPTAPPA